MKAGLVTLVISLYFITSEALASDLLSKKWQSLYGSYIEFDVYRKDRKVGQYTTIFTQQDNRTLQVDINMDINIAIIFGWKYSYSYKATEIWQDGQLQSLDVTVDDDGDINQLTAKNQQLQLTGTLNEQSFSVDLPIFPTHHYNVDVVKEQRVFNTLTGKENAVDIIDKGMDEILVGDQIISAFQYQYEGELHDTNVWYTANGTWVKMVFLGTDGNAIELRCTRCGQ